MHPVLRISELLYHIFQNLNPDPERGSRRDIFSCSLTCKAFSEAALDVMWENLPSVTLLPFASPSKYKDLGYTYMEDLERLKFYGKRVRVLWIRSDLSTIFLRFIACLRDVRSYRINPDDSNPILPMILPGLTTLNMVLPSTHMNDNPIEARIRTFLLPTVKSLSLHCHPNANHEDLTLILRSINSVNPNLSSLTLDEELFLGSPQLPPAELELELTMLIQALSHLESLSLPLSVVTVPVLVSTAGLPELKRLKLSHPLQMQSIRSTFLNPLGDFRLTTLHRDAFLNLQSLEINTKFDYLHKPLYAHSSLASHITHLSFTSVTPLSNFTMERLFPPSLSSSSFPILTHLSFTFISSFPIPATNGPVVNFLRPLFAAPFVSHLTSLLLKHGAPFNLNDEEYDEIARRLPNIEFLRFEVARHRLPRVILQSQKRGIRASLVALVSFLKHCPKLREIALMVDAETRPVPVGEVAEMPRGTHAVKVDMLVSPVGKDFVIVATFFARHFPDRRSELTSSWLDFAESPKIYIPLYREYGSMLRREREDPCVTYASRWRSIAELAHKEKFT